MSLPIKVKDIHKNEIEKVKESGYEGMEKDTREAEGAPNAIKERYYKAKIEDELLGSRPSFQKIHQ